MRSIRKISRALDRVSRRVGSGRHCPVCERDSGRFEAFGEPPRDDARCPWCGALERHRLLWLFLKERTDLFDGRPKAMLHVAPEPVFVERFQGLLGDGYLTADLFDPRAMVRMDITDIDRPDDSFDVVYCSHVLEHVDDDRQAMREFRRVLKPDGWAILLVPIDPERAETFEDPTVTTPEDRLRIFGQEDHARIYGHDYVDRLRACGFEVETTEVADLVSPDDARRMALTAAAGSIHLCR